MTTEWPRTVTTRRELALPPEIVALVLSFKPVDSGHMGKIVRSGHSIRWPYYYDCCGKYDSYYPKPCRWIDDEGRYHPGTLEPGSYEYKENASGSHGGYLRWTCCGATFGEHDDSPVGCTPLDLTLRVTTITLPSTESDSEETV